MATKWQRLIKFQDSKGQTKFGEPIIDGADDLLTQLEKGDLKAKEYSGSDAFDLQETGNEIEVTSHLLPILRPEDVPIIKCIGLNYTNHSRSISMLREFRKRR